jgi:hypothetical protein
MITWLLFWDRKNKCKFGMIEIKYYSNISIQPHILICISKSIKNYIYKLENLFTIICEGDIMLSFMVYLSGKV